MTSDEINEKLREALRLAKAEMIASGNWSAKNDGWPEARRKVEAALALEPAPPREPENAAPRCVECREPPQRCECPRYVAVGDELPRGPATDMGGRSCRCGHRSDLHGASIGCEMCVCEWYRPAPPPVGAQRGGQAVIDLPPGVRLRYLPAWLPMAGITLGKTIFIKRGQESAIPHELVHIDQQRRSGTFTFYFRYIFFRKARMEYEAEAYAVDVMAGEGLDWCAGALSSALYLWPCSKLYAKAAILRWMK